MTTIGTTSAPRTHGEHRRPRLRLVGAGRFVLLASLLSLLLAACGSENSSTTKAPAANQNYSASDLPRFVLSSSQLPPGYSQTEAKAVPANNLSSMVKTRQQAAQLGELSANGLQDVYDVEFHKGNDSGNNDPGSGAFAFANAQDASRALALLRSIFSANTYANGGGPGSGTLTSIPVSGLGDQSVPGVNINVGDGYAFYLYFWRDRNVDAFVGAGNTLGDMSQKSVLTIAQEIDYAGTH